MLRVLAKMGVEKIFASPGSEWSPVWEALAEPGVEGMPKKLRSAWRAATPSLRENCPR